MRHSQDAKKNFISPGGAFAIQIAGGMIPMLWHNCCMICLMQKEMKSFYSLYECMHHSALTSIFRFSLLYVRYSVLGTAERALSTADILVNGVSEGHPPPWKSPLVAKVHTSTAVESRNEDHTAAGGDWVSVSQGKSPQKKTEPEVLSALQVIHTCVTFSSTCFC